VTLSSGVHALSFIDRRGGPPYVTASKPRQVTLPPEKRAYFLVAKYRSDGRVLHPATTIHVSRIGLGGLATLNLSGAGAQELDYCQRSPGDQQTDPGNYVTVSPVEPTIQATLPPPH